MPKLGRKVKRAMRRMEKENRRFSKHIRKKVIPKADASTADAIQGIALDLLGLVIKAWPVDTGRSRAAWNAAIARIGGRGAHDRIKRRVIGARPEGRRQGSLKKRLRGKHPYIEITNAVDYAVLLEAGSSQQAPRGVLAQAFRFVRTKKMPEEFRAKWRGIR